MAGKNIGNVYVQLYVWLAFSTLVFVFSYAILHELRTDLLVKWRYKQIVDASLESTDSFKKSNPVNVVQNVLDLLGFGEPVFQTVLPSAGLTSDHILSISNGCLWLWIGFTLSKFSPALSIAVYGFVVGNMKNVLVISQADNLAQLLEESDFSLILFLAVATTLSFISSHIRRLHIAMIIFLFATCLHEECFELNGFIEFLKEFGKADEKSGIFWLRLCISISYISMVLHDMFVYYFVQIFVELVHMSWIILTAMTIVETSINHLFAIPDEKLKGVNENKNQRNANSFSSVIVPGFCITFGISAVLLRLSLVKNFQKTSSLNGYSRRNILMRGFGCGIGVLLGVIFWTAYTNPESMRLNLENVYPSLVVVAVAAMYIQISFFTNSSKSSFVKVQMCRSDDFLTMTYVKVPPSVKIGSACLDLKPSSSSAKVLSSEKDEGFSENGKAEKKKTLDLKMRYNDARVKSLDDELSLARKYYESICLQLKYIVPKKLLDREKSDESLKLQNKLKVCRCKRDLAVAAANVAKLTESLAKLVREIEVEVQIEKDSLKQVELDLNTMLSKQAHQSSSEMSLVKKAISNAMDVYRNIREDMEAAEENVVRASQTLKVRSNECLKAVSAAKKQAISLNEPYVVVELNQIKENLLATLSDVTMHGVSATLTTSDSVISIDVGPIEDEKKGDPESGVNPGVIRKTTKHIGANMDSGLHGLGSSNGRFPDSKSSSSDSKKKRTRWFWSRHKRAKMAKETSYDSIDSDFNTNSPDKVSGFFLRRKR